MTRLFKRKGIKEMPSPGKDKLAHAIVSKVNAFQVKWAAFMQRKSERFSLRTKKWFTILAALFCFVYSLYIMAMAITGRVGKSYSFTRIQAPKYITRTSEEKVMPKNTISENDYRRAKQFLLYMDSLNHASQGQRIADSIRFRRPGLIDSAQELEKLYELQQSLKK